MNTIIVGYTDRAALSAPEIICGPETPPADQAALMEAAKRRHEFPEQISRLEQYALGEAVEIAIFISEEAAAAAQDSDDRKKKLEKERRQAAQAQVRKDAHLILANKTFSAYAEKRNSAIAAVAAQKAQLSAALDEKSKAAILAKLQKLQPAADQAIAEFKIVLAARDTIKNPKSDPEDVADAAELIKEPARITKAVKAIAETAAANVEREKRNAELAAKKAAEEKAAADKKAADEKAAAEKTAAEEKPKEESKPAESPEAS